MTARSDSTSDKLDSRVSRIESEIESLAQSVNGLASNMTRMQDGIRDQIESITSNFSGSLKELTQKVSDRQRTNWGTIAAIAGVCVAIVAGYANLNLQPMRESMMNLEARVDLAISQANRNETNIASQNVRNMEIETQFRTSKELEEERFRHVRELDALHNQISRERIDHLREIQGLKPEEIRSSPAHE